MPCYEPNIVLVDNYPKTYGEPAKILKFINSKSADFAGYEKYEKANKEFATSEYNWRYEFQKIPCKWCAGCQETYSKQWAARCMLEANQYEQNYFLTLTYDEDHIPRDDEVVNKKTGEIFENDNWMQGHLEPDDIKDFLKRLRRHWKYHYDFPKNEIIGYDENGKEIKPPGIRFYLCGEYGGQTQRPHYHAIMFNMPIKPESLEVYKMDKATGNVTYTSKEIEKIWGKGFITIGEVNWDTCAYVARYVMKKMKGWRSDESYYEQGMSPEFVRMSRMPGIGLDFFNKNFQEIYARDEIIIKGRKESISTIKPPEYYDRIFAINHPEQMAAIKERRKMIAKNQVALKNAQTSLTEKERLQIEQRTKVNKWKTLARNKV